MRPWVDKGCDGVAAVDHGVELGEVAGAENIARERGHECHNAAEACTDDTDRDDEASRLR